MPPSPAATTVRFCEGRMPDGNTTTLASVNAPFKVGRAEQPVWRRCLIERLSVRIG